MNEDKPKITKIGIMVIEEASNIPVSLESIIEEVKMKAREVGADCVILQEKDDELVASAEGGCFSTTVYTFILGKL